MAWYMAELLVLVVIAGLVLLYAADRARKLRARARRMGAMNDRLDVAAAKVDKQQERKQARVRASAELTSVLPAIKRPPLTLPGVPGPATEPEEEEPAAAEPAAKAVPHGTQPAAGDTPAAGDDTPAQAGDTPAQAGDTPAQAGDTPAQAGDTSAEAGDAPAEADAGHTPDGAAAEQSPAAQAAPVAGDSPDAGDSPAVADEVTPEPVRVPEGTLTMGTVSPDATPAPKLQVTSDGTLIMPPVPGQGPAPAGKAAPPPTPRARPRASQRNISQERANRY
jgi:type II secretory pathway pseudopilin PulG